MPRWIYGNPPDSAHRSEQLVAEALQSLPEGFWIRWDFHYKDPNSGLEREGDFVIQGPDGHFLVLEVKGGHPACDQSTGVWKTIDAENPFDQLDDEWRGIKYQMQAQASQVDIKLPFIDRALGLPDVEIAGGQANYQGMDRNQVVSAGDFRNFAAWWRTRYGTRHLHCSLTEARNLFDAVFSADAPAGATVHTLDFADQVIERQTLCHFDLLDALSENDQLLFSGGPGTGKTWLALEQAKRWSESGLEVLFLCYNLELEAWLKSVCRKKHKRISLFSFQSLAASILGKSIPTDFKTREAESCYFDVELPLELAQRVLSPDFQPRYDALVVDEAQDHNTEPSIEGLGTSPGWWGIYLKLLKKGCESPIAIFHDRAQRLGLRQGDFKAEYLANFLIKPVNVRLDHPVRYTRQLRNYFRSLNCAATADLLRDMAGSVRVLAEGPEPKLITDTSELDEGLRCAEVIRGWIDHELAKPNEIMVLYPSSRNIPSWLKQGKIHGVQFHLGTEGVPVGAIPAVSIHRAKGLERRAIVLVGLPDWINASQDSYKARMFVQGVTRARQLLTVITRPVVATT